MTPIGDKTFQNFDDKLQGFPKYAALEAGQRLQVLNGAAQRVAKYYNAKGRSEYRRDNLDVAGAVVVANAFTSYYGTLKRNADADTDPPLVVSEQSSLAEGTPTHSRIEAGEYALTLAGAFPLAKTRVFTDMRPFVVGSEYQVRGFRYSDDQVRYIVMDSGGNKIDGFENVYITIQVEP